jgi:arylsulfatase A-like enzyme
MFVWLERIPGGRRFREPVSMIDVLPTILDLLNLPLPETLQGQSLAPLLLGEEGWEPLPVILDEFNVDAETGALRGQIELIDGRWGASLEVNPAESVDIGGVGAKTDERRPVPLLLYDLWSDPYTLESLHEERPRLAEKYRRLLEARLREHLSQGERFTQSENVAVTSDQLRALQSLGYIQ